MIFFVTSSNCHQVIRKYAGNLNLTESIKFLIYDYVVEPRRTHDLDGAIFFTSGDELDKYLLDKFEQSDKLISFDNFHIFKGGALEKIKDRSANFHPSPLPSYRGLNPVSWGLFNEEVHWGISWHRIARTLDTGQVLFQKMFVIPKGVYQHQLLEYSILLGLKSVNEAIQAIDGKNCNFQLGGNKSLKNKNNTYSASDVPLLIINTYEDVERFSRFVPFTPVVGWRWRILLLNKYVSLVSTKATFADIQLKKTVYLNKCLVYYAD